MVDWNLKMALPIFLALIPRTMNMHVIMHVIMLPYKGILQMKFMLLISWLWINQRRGHQGRPNLITRVLERLKVFSSYWQKKSVKAQEGFGALWMTLKLEGAAYRNWELLLVAENKHWPTASQWMKTSILHIHILPIIWNIMEANYPKTF